jgi:N-methylhydantoinase B
MVEGTSGWRPRRRGWAKVLSASELEVMRQALTSVPEEMGVVLIRSAYSPNIKERRDASCAIFDPVGRMVAQAEHIPVHLGSMPMAVEALFTRGDDVGPGDAWIVNDPYSGGSHLNDVTIISPVHSGDGDLLGFAVNKAHHADVGGSAPGSMPATARSLTEEGVVLHLQRLRRGGEPAGDAWEMLVEASRTPDERAGDLKAQLSACAVGGTRLRAFVDRYGPPSWAGFCDQVIEYSRRRMGAALRELEEGTFAGSDTLGAPALPSAELPGVGVPDVDELTVSVEVTVGDSQVEFDFEGTSPEVEAPFNAPYSVTLSAVYFALRAATDPTIPPNHGCYLPVTVRCPEGSLLNPTPSHPTGAGNVETSQRIGDVCLAALGRATADGPVAMSQGTMNNVLIGRSGEGAFTLYETIGGGEGGSPWRAGMSGVHTHMTNTANTPVEAMEAFYPLRVRRLGLREGSLGTGHHPGGEGIAKEIEVLCDSAVLTLLADRRASGPPGASGGSEGAPGRDRLMRGGLWYLLPSKCVVKLHRGDVLSIETPGGGGWGREDSGEGQ